MADDPLVMPQDEFALVRKVAEAAYRNWRIGDDGEGCLHAALVAYERARGAGDTQGWEARARAAEAKLAAIQELESRPGWLTPFEVQRKVLAIIGGEREAEAVAALTVRMHLPAVRTALEAAVAGAGDEMLARPYVGALEALAAADSHSAACSDCGELFADSETGEYLFTKRERMEMLLRADGWKTGPVLCPACQEEGDRG